MATVEQALQNAIGKIPDCLGVGLVDMREGLLLGAKTLGNHPQEILDLTAAATKDMFLGDNIRTIEELFRKARGDEAAASAAVTMFMFKTSRTLHLFFRSEKRPSLVLVVICKITANLGMALMKGQEQLAPCEASV